MRLPRIDRKMWAIISALILADAVLLAVTFLETPAGHAFAPGGFDGMAALNLMKSHESGFSHPFVPGKSIFSDINFSSLYYYAFLGVIADLLNADYFAFLLVADFIAAFLFLACLSMVIIHFLPRHAAQALAFAAMAPGLMFLLYLAEFLGLRQLSFLETNSVLPPLSIIFPVLHRSYIAVSYALGLLGMLMTMQKKHIAAGILLGISSLVYPHIGFVFLVLAVLYPCIKSGDANVLTRQNMTIAGIFLLLSLPWAYPYFAGAEFFQAYRNLYFASSGGILDIVATSFFLLAPAFLQGVSWLRRMFAPRTFVVTGVAWLLALLSNVFLSGNKYIVAAAESSEAFKLLIGAIRVLNPVIQAVFAAAAAYTIWSLVKTKSLKTNEKFVMTWLIITLALFVMDKDYVFWNPSRISYLLLVPATVLAYMFLMRWPGLGRKALAASAIILVLSLAFYAAYGQPRDKNPLYGFTYPYLKQDDHNALLFLKNLPEGRADSIERFKLLVPYYASKQSTLNSFYGGLAPDIWGVLSRHDESVSAYLAENEIRYLLLDNDVYYPYLRKIYDAGGIRIYENTELK